jgi:hypothetical protein
MRCTVFPTAGCWVTASLTFVTEHFEKLGDYSVVKGSFHQGLPLLSTTNLVVDTELFAEQDLLWYPDADMAGRLSGKYYGLREWECHTACLSGKYIAFDLEKGQIILPLFVGLLRLYQPFYGIPSLSVLW